MALAKNDNTSKLFNNSKTTKRVVMLVLFAILVLGGYNLVSSYFMYCDQTLSRLDAVAKTLSYEINGDVHYLLTSSVKDSTQIRKNEDNSLYKEIRETLVKAQKANGLSSDISTLIYDEKKDQFYYVVNSGLEPYYLDEYYQNKEQFLKLYKTGGKLPVYSDEYGTWLTAICPIKNSSGNVVAIVEVDEKYGDFLDVIDGDLYKKIGISLLIFVITAVILLWQLRQILLGEDAIKKELEESYDVINQHNEDMLNSINYAKKIQTAILPPLQVIKTNIPTSFVFYLPKDIVSGDFYFFKQIDEGSKYLIAACDCTGHGVPGALMSIIGSNFLDHIVSEDVYSPAEILTRLNKSVINTLRQDDLNSESRDGMDMAICLIDKKNNTVTYAGANRPLYTVDAEGLCLETKGDKRPIGGLDNSLFVFKEHSFIIDKNTSYYMFTDGFIDQFGGEKDKKFTTKRFKELLAQIAKLGLPEQKQTIESAFYNWKTKNEQTDDVLVIGFKVD